MIEKKDFLCIEQPFIQNPFHAPVYYIEKTSSTMHIARVYANQGVPHGTLIYAGEQTAGRGRIAGRKWFALPRQNILTTIMLQQPFSTDFTLRIGLAVSTLIDMFLPAGIMSTVKWPNDVLIGGKKAAGILCEMCGSYLLVGIGINVFQTDFPNQPEDTCTSIASLSGAENCPSIQMIIPYLLKQIQLVLLNTCWHTELTKRLWKNHCPVSFICGHTQTQIQEGILDGIAEDGAIRIKNSSTVHLYYSGELSFH